MTKYISYGQVAARLRGDERAEERTFGPETKSAHPMRCQPNQTESLSVLSFFTRTALTVRCQPNTLIIIINLNFGLHNRPEQLNIKYGKHSEFSTVPFLQRKDKRYRVFFYTGPPLKS